MKIQVWNWLNEKLAILLVIFTIMHTQDQFFLKNIL